MQQVCPRWQPMQPGTPRGRQVPLARGMHQLPPRGVPDQQPQSTEPGGASQCLGMEQPPQAQGGPGEMQAQRQPFKCGQNVRNQPQGHSGTVSMQSQDPAQQAIHVPVSIHVPSRFLGQM